VAHVRVVTDSTADLDRETASSLGIEVVPIYVRWGEELFRDGVDLTPAEFYRRLSQNESHPATTQPAPDDFSRVYTSKTEAPGIVSIHISSKISGTYNAARLGAQTLGGSASIEVVDSGLNSSGLAMVVLAAARAAAGGASFADVVAEARRACVETRMVGLFDTMKYLARGGRISPAIALAAGVMRVKPILTFRDGEIVRAGLVRSREAGMRRLLHLLSEMGALREVVVSHSTQRDELDGFLQSLRRIYPGLANKVFEMGAALGVHGGPGMIIVAARRAQAM
jgi:DegV family protein with EDD domain